jgi:peptide/nickel transport system substrate-binding protein
MKHHTRNQFVFSALLGALAVFGTSCGDGSGTQDTSAGGKSQGGVAEQIIVGIQQEADTFMPALGSMAAKGEISGALFRGLIEMDSDWNYTPDMAEWIPSIENGHIKLLPDGKMVTEWKLKDGLKWEDGQPITVDDVLFAYEYMMSEKVPVQSRDVEKRIEKIEKISDLEFHVHWKVLYANAFLGHSIMPKHILGPQFYEDASKMERHPYGRKPVGNGPYRFVEWRPGDSISLEPNPHYTGAEKPKTKRLIWRFVSSTQTLQSNMIAGSVDAISPTGIPFDEAVILEKQRKPNLKFHIIPGMVWEHVDMNLDHPILKDKRVRQALLHAIDRDGMVAALFEGKQPVAHSWLPPKHYGYDPNVKKYDYNIKSAEALLDAAGWTRKGGQQHRSNDKGEVLRLTISTTQGNNTRERVQQLIQNDLKKIGVDLVIKNYDAKVFFSEITAKRKFEMAMYAWITSPTSDGENLWPSDKIPSEANNWLGQNYPGLSNARIDEIDKKIPETMDKNERVKLFHEQQAIWTDELPSLPLYFRAEASVTKSNFHNWKPTGTANPITWNAQQWYLAR